MANLSSGLSGAGKPKTAGTVDEGAGTEGSKGEGRGEHDRREAFTACSREPETSSGRLYLMVMPDLWDCTVIGWAYSEDMEAGQGIVQAFACAESLFKTLKMEVEVFEYMELYYTKR
jgi:hypothetical protein